MYIRQLFAHKRGGVIVNARLELPTLETVYLIIVIDYDRRPWRDVLAKGLILIPRLDGNVIIQIYLF